MGWYMPLFKRGNALAQKKKTAANGGKKDTKKKEYYISVGMAQGMCFGIAIYSEGGYEHG